MASPVIADTIISDDVGTSHTVSLPPNIVDGNLLIVAFTEDGNRVITFPNEGTDWIVLAYQSHPDNKPRIKICYRNADGTEGASITVTTSGNEVSTHCAYRITGHSTTQNPEVGSTNTGTSVSPDPLIVTPTGGSKDYLFIACAGIDRDRTTTGWPTNYTYNQLTSSVGGANGCNCSIAGRQYTNASDDPSVFTISTSDEWITVTIAVHPAGVAGGWTGKINGVTNPSKVNGIAVANITKINGVS